MIRMMYRRGIDDSRRAFELKYIQTCKTLRPAFNGVVRGQARWSPSASLRYNIS